MSVTNPNEFIWEQKYRPTNIEDIILPKELKDLFLNFAAEGRIPSFLLYSPTPGTGKTTTARALSSAIGCSTPLFINASLDTSIDNIRTKVLQYSTTVSVIGNAKQKVVILDECLEENTKILAYDENGNEVSIRIGDLNIGETLSLPSFNMETGEFEEDTAEVIKYREVEVFEVKLRSGKIVLLTENHPMILLEDEDFISRTISTGLSVYDMVVVRGESNNRVMDFITSIKFVGVRRVVNLTVNKNHTFLTEDGIVTHNCERLSVAAQESLKGIMESVSKNCSFILTSNSIQKIVKPLVSRCRRVDFIWDKKTTDSLKVQMCLRCCEILTQEGVPFDKKAVLGVVQNYYPDNRSILGALQSYAQQNGKIDLGIISILGGDQYDHLLKIMKEHNFKDLSQWVMDNVETIGPDFYGRFFRYLYPPVNIRETIPARVTQSSIPYLVTTLGEEQKWHAGTPDPYLHILSTLTSIMTEPEIKFI
jgi:DNA polymerase III delta prime subunit